MSSSKGIVLLPKDLLKIMPPDALRRMILGRDPARALDLDLGEGFPRFMDEYRAETGETRVPFNHLVIVAQTVGGDVGGRGRDAAARRVRGGGARTGRSSRRDLSYARNWAEGWAPGVDAARVLDAGGVARGGGGARRRAARVPAPTSPRSSRPEMDGEAVQDLLYSTAVGRGLKPKRAFAAVYTVLARQDERAEGRSLRRRAPRRARAREVLRVRRDTDIGEREWR